MDNYLKEIATKLAEKKSLSTTELMDLMDNGLCEPIITVGKQTQRTQETDGTYFGGFTLTEKGRKLASE
jgi:Mn-dependent DtxR family transcriptional regulator